MEKYAPKEQNSRPSVCSLFLPDPKPCSLPSQKGKYQGQLDGVHLILLVQTVQIKKQVHTSISF